LEYGWGPRRRQECDDGSTAVPEVAEGPVRLHSDGLCVAAHGCGGPVSTSKRGRRNKEAENAGPRARATEVVARGPKGLMRGGLVLYRAIEPSTTLAEVGLMSSYKMRRVGGAPTWLATMTLSPIRGFVRVRKADLRKCPPSPQQAGACPPWRRARGPRRKRRRRRTERRRRRR
jgi:hypothetical protein